jgi:hypothetical protein
MGVGFRVQDLGFVVWYLGVGRSVEDVLHGVRGVECRVLGVGGEERGRAYTRAGERKSIAKSTEPSNNNTHRRVGERERHERET